MAEKQEGQQPNPTPDRNPGNKLRDEITGRFTSRRESGEAAEYDEEFGESLDRSLGEAGLAEPHDPNVEELGTQPPEPLNVTPPVEPSGEPGRPTEPLEPTETVQVKVNGKLLDVPADEVENAGGVAAFQLNEAAKERLEQAKELERRNAALAQELESKLQAVPQPEPQQTSVAKDEIKKIKDDLLYGTDEEQVAATQRLAGIGQQPSVQSAEIQQQVQISLQRESALDQFKKDYPEVWADDNLRQMAFDKDDKKRTSNPTQDFTERYAEIGTEVREWVNGISGGSNQPTEPSDTLQKRSERKQRATTPPSASPGGGGRPANAPRQPTERERHQSAIDSMRKMRNQA